MPGVGFGKFAGDEVRARTIAGQRGHDNTSGEFQGSELNRVKKYFRWARLMVERRDWSPGTSRGRRRVCPSASTLSPLREQRQISAFLLVLAEAN